MVLRNMKSDPIQHIDLNNFEDTEFESSQYVLTSPRSLEACEKLNIKPVELLYTPISSLEVMYPQYSTGEVNQLYLRTEENRRRKIKLCRDTRNKLLLNDQILPKNTNSLSISGNSLLPKGDNIVRPEELSLQFQSTGASPTAGSRSKNRITSAQTKALTEKLHPQKSAYCQPKGSNSMNTFLREKEVFQRKLDIEQQRLAELEEGRKKLNDRPLTSKRSSVLSQRNRDRQAQVLQRQYEIQARKQALDKDVERYREELKEYQHTALELAQQRAAEKLAAEQQKLAFERRQREIQQQANLQELERLALERKQAVEEAAFQKEQHARQVAKEREQIFLESRHLAHAAEKLREEIRQAYQLDSFDKLAQHAELRNTLGLGND